MFWRWFPGGVLGRGPRGPLGALQGPLFGFQIVSKSYRNSYYFQLQTEENLDTISIRFLDTISIRFGAPVRCFGGGSLGFFKGVP